MNLTILSILLTDSWKQKRQRMRIRHIRISIQSSIHSTSAFDSACFRYFPTFLRFSVSWAIFSFSFVTIIASTWWVLCDIIFKSRFSAAILLDICEAIKEGGTFINVKFILNNILVHYEIMTLQRFGVRYLSTHVCWNLYILYVCLFDFISIPKSIFIYFSLLVLLENCS